MDSKGQAKYEYLPAPHQEEPSLGPDLAPSAPDQQLAAEQRLLRNVIPACYQGTRDRQTWVCAKDMGDTWMTATAASTMSVSVSHSNAWLWWPPHAQRNKAV